MANDSLKQEARARQSLPEILGILDKKSPDSGSFDDILQAMTFSLTFTSSQWCLFWRLLNVGCMLADELLDLISGPTSKAKPDTALLWNRLSEELAMHLEQNEVQRIVGKGAFKMTR